MLIRLFGQNFRSLKAPFELSMVAADLRWKEDLNRGIIQVPLVGMDEPLVLLRCVALYGANASGKSTVLTAARAINWLVTHSSSASKPDDRIPPYEPFLLDDLTIKQPIELGCDVAYSGSILRYRIEFDAKLIRRESLDLIRGDEETRLIDRRPSGEVSGDLIVNSDANRLYVKEMQPNVAVLSKLAQHGPHKGKESVRPYHHAISNATRCEDYSNAAQMTLRLNESDNDDRFAKDKKYREWIMKHLIRAADVGISDVKTRREPLQIPAEVRERLGDALGFPDSRVVISFMHEGSSKAAINFSDESAGTKKLYNIASDWWALAHQSVSLFADELSASLHPRLLDRLIRAVNDISAETTSQLVFTTHDTGLLESHDGKPPALRRDQVYFTKKDASGATELYSLTEFKENARQVHNIRKRYMSGLYGALPSVEQLSL